VGDAVAGFALGVLGLSDLRPLPLPTSAGIFGYSALCALGPNDLLKAVLVARASRTSG